MSKGKREMPRVEEDKKEAFDPMPIMVAPSKRLGQSVVDEDQEIESIAVAGRLKGATVTIDDLEDEVEEEKEEDKRFGVFISKLAKTVSPDVREAIKGTQCFGRWWKDEENVCPEEACELRDYCRNVYEQVTGDVEKDEVEEVAEPAPKRQQRVATQKKAQGSIAANAAKRKLQKGKKKRKLGEPVPEKPTRPPWEAEKYKRRAYVSTGRPVDVIVDALWHGLDQPPSLPEKWKYAKSKSFEDRQYAQAHFQKSYGRGLMVCRRASYHLYYNNGLHVCRIWVNAGGGGLMDVCPAVADALEEESFEMEDAIPKNRRHIFQFFTKRCWIGTREQAQKAAECIKSVLKKMQVR